MELEKITNRFEPFTWYDVLIGRNEKADFDGVQVRVYAYKGEEIWDMENPTIHKVGMTKKPSGKNKKLTEGDE